MLRKHVFGMEIFDLEDYTMEEKQISEVLSLFWAGFKCIVDIEAVS
jgi:hypothetical protein